MRSIAAIAFAALLAVGCAPAATQADTAPGAMTTWNDWGSLADVVKKSDLIVEGRVARVLGDRDVRGSPAQRIPVAFTESLVDVKTVLKGSAGTQVRVVQLGRENDTAQTYPEFPLMRAGDEVIVFLLDVTNHPTHADGTPKFAVISPVGLLQLRNGRVVTFAHGFASTDRAASMSPAQLREEIRRLAAN